MRHLLLCLACLLTLAACGYVPTAKSGADDPLLFDAGEVARADKIAVFIPGALSSIDVFEGSRFWEDAGYARAFYRYPGLDGMAIDHHVDPATAAARITAFANRYPDKDIALVGYSTGGLIALEAAADMTKGRRVHVAAMSTAVEYGGGVSTIARGARDILRAVVATKSVRKADIWKRYWSGLLFGPDALDNPQLAAPLAQKIAEGEKIYVKLNPQIAIAHALALPGWELPSDLDLTGVDTAFFIGLNDPVFSTAQTTAFAAQIGGVPVYGYPGQGHLLFFTRPDVFRDMLQFAEGEDPLIP
ncbi:alpha/beta fold hydrolase [Yoonia sp. R2331]|uniref:alpha/beta fold hydrolase n=1 Tax=Yoonia sp. R2331 TaxID=3237238 RepID=UPI0034E3ED94